MVGFGWIFFGGIWMEDVKFKIEDFEMYDV
jgi:hypothetical protein